MSQGENLMRFSYSGGSGGGGGGGSGGGSGGGVPCGGGGSSSKSKKGKPKKVPQRGLGVAQLERIRIEEQQKREAALQAANALANNAINNSHSDSTPSSDVQCLSPPPNSLFRSSQSYPNKLNSAGGEIDSRVILSPRNENLSRLEHHRFTFPGQGNLPYESRPKSPLNLPNSSQRLNHFQQPSFTSMMNNSHSSGISPSSMRNSQLEPPSSQSVLGNIYTTSRAEEDKVLGMRRLCPFSVESQRASSSQSIYASRSRSRSDELAAFSNGYTDHTEPRSKYLRTSEPELSPTGKIVSDEKLHGDFLTLAPPAYASQSFNSNHKNLEYYSPPQERELPSQENGRSNIHYQEANDTSEMTISLFPDKLPSEQASTSNGNATAIRGETLDLTLRL